MNVEDGQKMDNMYIIDVHNKEGWNNEDNKYLGLISRKLARKKSWIYWLKEHIVSQTKKRGRAHRMVNFAMYLTKIFVYYNKESFEPAGIISYNLWWERKQAGFRYLQRNIQLLK